MSRAASQRAPTTIHLNQAALLLLVSTTLLNCARADPESAQGLLPPAAEPFQPQPPNGGNSRKRQYSAVGVPSEETLARKDDKNARPGFHPDSLARPLRTRVVNGKIAGAFRQYLRRLSQTSFTTDRPSFQPRPRANENVVGGRTKTKPPDIGGKERSRGLVPTKIVHRGRVSDAGKVERGETEEERVVAAAQGSSSDVNQLKHSRKDERNGTAAAAANASSINASKKSLAPKLEMLQSRGGGSASFKPVNDEENEPDGSLAALFIGLTFVAVFVAAGFGLLIHARVFRSLQMEKSKQVRNFKRAMSLDEEDGTPPELRSGCGQPSFVQPDQISSLGDENGGPAHQGGKCTRPFFNGKLVLREVASGQCVTKCSPPFGSDQCNNLATTLGAIPKKMPSPAAKVQVTEDLLVSPKCDNVGDTTESEEDSSDDTVYECPGLAASSGEELVVSNPFFMHDEQVSSVGLPQKPIAISHGITTSLN